MTTLWFALGGLACQLLTGGPARHAGLAAGVLHVRAVVVCQTDAGPERLYLTRSACVSADAATAVRCFPLPD